MPVARDPMTEFTCKSARDGSLVIGLGLAMFIETVVMHLWLAGAHPLLAWGLTTSSVLTIGWIAVNYYALGWMVLRINVDSVDMLTWRRPVMRVPLNIVASVAHSAWRDVPAIGTPESREYRNAMKPATPNVVVTLVALTKLDFRGGAVRPVRKFGLKLDDPDGFIAAYNVVQSPFRVMP